MSNIRLSLSVETEEFVLRKLRSSECGFWARFEASNKTLLVV